MKSAAGVRAVLHERKAIVVSLAAIAIIAAAISIWANIKRTPGYAKRAFYSDDDGASYFEDSNKLIAPFDHHGKKAYRAYIFACMNTKQKWVGYLEGYRPEALPKAVEIHALMDKLAENPNSAPPPMNKDPMYVLPELQKKGLVIKRPDAPGKPANKWVCEADGDAYAEVRQPACPHDGKHDVMAVLP